MKASFFAYTTLLVLLFFNLHFVFISYNFNFLKVLFSNNNINQGLERRKWCFADFNNNFLLRAKCL